ncbi:hypothetical protein EAF04_010022 [Stromatinia cepivora]|nr:hypothetical protein EAF04_010022 [Stromatinia cepivora]
MQYGDETGNEGLQIVHSSSMKIPTFRPKYSSLWRAPRDGISNEEASNKEQTCVICAKTKALFDAMQGHISFEPSLPKAPYKDWSLTWAGSIDYAAFRSKEASDDYPVITSLDPQDHTVEGSNTSRTELDFSSTLSPETTAEIISWAQKCVTSYTKCRRILGSNGHDQFEPEAEWFPDRLIKITRTDDAEAGSTEITARVVVKSDPADSPPETKGRNYLSLSHSWGPSPNPSAPLGGRAGTVLTELNLASWRVDLSLDDLPLTFRHAVIVCASLGFQYIWIDSLCILQESVNVEDWKAQSAVMGDVYKFAWLNIAALSTASDYDGFINECRDPGVEFGFRAPFASILGHDHKTRNADGQECILLRGKAKFLWNFCSDIPGSTASNAPLFTRAWLYQERDLARRTLALAKSSVYWACDEDSYGEQPEWGGIEGSGLRRTLHSVRETTASKQSTAGPSWTNEQIWNLLKTFEMRWQSTIISYTLCNLTKHTDKLIAVSSIAQELANTMPKKYLAGLWDVNYFIFASGNKQIALADVLAADVALETDYSFAFVKAGWLRIRERLNRVKATKTTAPSWNTSEKSTSLTDEVTGQDLWFTGDTVEAYELIKSRKGVERLVWIPLLASLDSTVSCQCLYLIEVKASDQIGDDGKFVKPGEKVYRRVGSGNFGRVTSKLRQDKLLLELGTYPDIPEQDGQGQVLANGFKRREDGFQELVLV